MSTELSSLYSTVLGLCEEISYLISYKEEFIDIEHKYDVLQRYWRDLVSKIDDESASDPEYTNIIFKKSECDKLFNSWKSSRSQIRHTPALFEGSQHGSIGSNTSTSSYLQKKERVQIAKKKREHEESMHELYKKEIANEGKILEHEKKILEAQLEEEKAEISLSIQEEADLAESSYSVVNQGDVKNPIKTPYSFESVQNSVRPKVSTINLPTSSSNVQSSQYLNLGAVGPPNVQLPVTSADLNFGFSVNPNFGKSSFNYQNDNVYSTCNNVEPVRTYVNYSDHSTRLQNFSSNLGAPNSIMPSSLPYPVSNVVNSQYNPAARIMPMSSNRFPFATNMPNYSNVNVPAHCNAGFVSQNSNLFDSPYRHGNVNNFAMPQTNFVPNDVTYSNSLPISHVIQPQSNISPPIYDNNRVPQSTPAYHSEINSTTETIVQKLCQVISTPKLEYKVFNGEPLEYVTFMHNFETLLEANNPEDSHKLQLLIQHCSGKAKEAIESCVNLPSDIAFKTAKETLRENFGLPHIIAKAHMTKLNSLPVIKTADGANLMTFVRQLEITSRILAGMGDEYTQDLNHTNTLLELNRKLPLFLRAKWTEVAGKIIKSGLRPKFNNFLCFIKERASLVNNEYGEDLSNFNRKSDHNHNDTKKVFTPKPRTLLTKASHSTEKRKVSNIAAKGSNCVVCSSSHPIWRCSKFLEFSSKQRYQIVKKFELCAICLNKHSGDVCDKSHFKCRICSGGDHNTLLHGVPVNVSVATVTAATGAGNGHVCIGIIPVKIRKKGCNVVKYTYALLDTGSEISLILQDAVDSLNIFGEKNPFTITGITGSKKIDSEIVDIIIESIKGDTVIELNDVRTVPVLPIDDSSIPKANDIGSWSHLSDIEFPEFDCSVSMILGVKQRPSLFIPLDYRKAGEFDPVAVRYSLGWMVLGSMGRMSGEEFSVNYVKVDSSFDSEDGLKQQLERLWNTDFGDLEVESKVGYSIEDKRALRLIEDNLKLIDGHFQVSLPWKHNPPFLPGNRSLAVNRLEGLSRRFKKNPELFGMYEATINDYLLKGHAEKIPLDEIHIKDRPIWYLPHHPVTHPLKPQKVRVVFDCAAKFRNTSLNSQLLQGPDLSNLLIGVLFKFRRGQVGFTADIEAHFHQVSVDPKDTDVLRFLWWKDGDYGNGDIEEYRMKKHIFGATSSPAIANFCVKRCADIFGNDFDEETVKSVKNNMYVDDLMKSVNSTPTAFKLYQELSDLLSTCGFRLTKWCSNSRELLEMIPEQDRAKTIVDLNMDLPTHSALGLKWNTETDVFLWQASEKLLHSSNVATTRRGILSVVYSLFDPIGFIAPFIMKAKLLLQTLSRKKLGWDDEIGIEHKLEWSRWFKDLDDLNSITVDRCIRPKLVENCEDIQLHIFSDASRVGYSSVAYLRFGGEHIHCAFVFGKCRLAPIREISIPRLELSAAVISVKMRKVIQEEFDLTITNVTFWTDSMSVLKCIRNESKRFHTFESNRLTVIHTGSNVTEWRYVNRDLNPADDGSKGLKLNTLIKNPRWLHGPEFLKKEESFWPERIDIPDLKDSDPEVRKEVQIYVANETTTTDIFDELFRRYSSWLKLKRVVALLLRVKLFLRSKVLKKDFKFDSKLSVDEIRAAEFEIIKILQSKVFPDGLKESCLRKLDPQMENGLLRVGGRLQKAPIDGELKHPLILPYKHHITDLVITSHHLEVGHLGQESVLSSLRCKYWIVKGRSAVRKVIHRCIICQRRSKRTEEQFMADLPQQRLTPDKPPFCYVGIDYFGPLLVKQGRSTVKRYGCLITCYTTRAIHIEVAHSLDTDSVINCLRRFISLRGYPEEIRSDNGSNFTKAEKELSESISSFNQVQLNNFCVQKDIKWSFNPPAASHMGGVWERLVRSVKQVARSVIGSQLVTDEVLLTVMAEVCFILNNRPLTRVSDDITDEAPLTPNHLLHLRSSSTTLPPGVFDVKDIYLKRKWRQAQYLISIFWGRWIKEYIPTLIERSKWLIKRNNLKIGDVVLLADENFPRGQWPLARIVDVIKSDDGLIRTVKIKTASTVATSAKRSRCKESKDSSIILTRPVTKICLLELHD